MRETEEAVGQRPPDVFNEGPLRMAPERLASVRRDARAGVESLKREAFGLLDRLS